MRSKNFSFPTAKYISVDGTKVCYYEEGKGIPLLMLPPWPGSSFVYLPLVEHLKKHYKIILLDLPGFGGHTQGIKKNDIAGVGEFVAKFVKKLGLKKMYLIGTSSGGAAAMYYCSLNPTGIIKQAIIAAPYAPETIKILSTKYRIFVILAKHSELFRKYVHKKYLTNGDRYIVRVLKSSDGLVKPEQIAQDPYFKRCIDDIRNIDFMGAIQIVDDLFKARFEDVFSKIETDTLVISGELDENVPKQYSINLANNILKHARYVEIPEAYHYDFMVKQNLFAEKILKFFTGKNINLKNCFL